MRRKKIHRQHKWKVVGGCEVNWSVVYIRLFCPVCRKRKLEWHTHGSKIMQSMFIPGNRKWEEYEIP